LSAADADTPDFAVQDVKQIRRVLNISEPNASLAGYDPLSALVPFLVEVETARGLGS